MGLFKFLGKIFGKKKALNKGTFHDDLETVETVSGPFGSYKIQRKRPTERVQTPADIEREEDEYARRLSEEAEQRLEEAVPEVHLSLEDDFIYNAEVARITGSAHVDFMQYLLKEETLYIGYHTNNSVYAYYGISEEEARGYFRLIRTGTPGNVGTTVVWAQLRRRGTAFGYSKDYTWMTGQGPEPLYKGTSVWEKEHMQIPPSGMIPESWKRPRAEGPYGEKETPFKPSWY